MHKLQGESTNKENLSPASEKTDEVSFLKLDSNFSTIMTLGVHGIEPYGIEHMKEKDFLASYRTDPIFKHKITLLFDEEAKLLTSKS